MKSKVIEFVSLDGLKSLALLRWQTAGANKGKVFVSYCYAFEQCEISDYIPKNIGDVLQKFCDKNGFVLWSY